MRTPDSFAQDLHLRAIVRSDGGVVRQRNEDAAYVGQDVLAVADGIGGHPAGHLASALVVREFKDLRRKDSEDCVDALRRATIAGSLSIAAYASSHMEVAGMGTTLTAVFLAGNQLGVLQSGDSRAYLFRTGRAYQLTRDDTLVQSLVEARSISREEARRHPRRNVVVRSLFGEQDDWFTICSFELEEGDRILLCSDGVSDVMSDADLEQEMAISDLDRCAERTVSDAIRRGSADNVTAIVAEVVQRPVVQRPIFAGSAAQYPEP